MNPSLQVLSANALRSLMLSEAKRFIRELERGASLAELEGIQAHMKDIADTLAAKELDESTIRIKK